MAQNPYKPLLRSSIGGGEAAIVYRQVVPPVLLGRAKDAGEI
ncbi:MAG TPA: hypothetical protein VHO43_19585 [Ignavibacteriales bacterium]|nr:hypothetical protein [Ignavibacteriales bacterium]